MASRCDVLSTSVTSRSCVIQQLCAYAALSTVDMPSTLIHGTFRATAHPTTRTARLPSARPRACAIGHGHSDTPPTLELEGIPIGHPTMLHTAWWRFGHWLHAHYFRQRTLGAQNLPKGGLFMLASNHASHLDCSSVFTAAQRGGCAHTYALGARDYFFTNAFVVRCSWRGLTSDAIDDGDDLPRCHSKQIPQQRWFVTCLMNVIPFNRRGFTQRDVDALLKAQRLASDTRAVGVRWALCVHKYTYTCVDHCLQTHSQRTYTGLFPPLSLASTENTHPHVKHCCAAKCIR